MIALRQFGKHGIILYSFLANAKSPLCAGRRPRPPVNRPPVHFPSPPPLGGGAVGRTATDAMRHSPPVAPCSAASGALALATRREECGTGRPDAPPRTSRVRRRRAGPARCTCRPSSAAQGRGKGRRQSVKCGGFLGGRMRPAGLGGGLSPPAIPSASRGDFRAVRGERICRRPRPPGPPRGVRSRRGARIPRMHGHKGGGKQSHTARQAARFSARLR